MIDCTFQNKDCAESLRTTLRSGVMNLKDRFFIRIDNDMRKGTIKFDQWTMGAKVSNKDYILFLISTKFMLTQHLLNLIILLCD